MSDEGGVDRQLPSSTGGILEWNTAEVESLLAGTSALAAAREIRSAAAASWREAAPVVTAAEEVSSLGRHWSLRRPAPTVHDTPSAPGTLMGVKGFQGCRV